MKPSLVSFKSASDEDKCSGYEQIAPTLQHRGTQKTIKLKTNLELI